MPDGRAGERGESAAPAIDPDIQELNAAALQAQRQSVVEASQSGGHPERLSPMVRGTPLDRAAWQRDPKATALAYAGIAEPARVHEHGRPGDPDIGLFGPSDLQATEGGSLSIWLQAAPYAPISVASADRVVFGNGLPYATIVADADGIARLDIGIPDGTTNLAKVLIASPVSPSTTDLLIDIPTR